MREKRQLLLCPPGEFQQMCFPALSPSPPAQVESANA